jgi:uncharacterized OsmC-like protein
MATTKTSTKRLNGIDLGRLNETITAVQNDPELGKSRFRARNTWVNGNHNRSTISGYYTAKEEMTHKKSFKLHADEHPILAGEDQAPNPVEHLLNALASCVTTSMVAHAAVRGIEIEQLECELEGDIDLNGFLGLDAKVPKGYTNVRLNYTVKTDPKNLKQLRRLADFSPVFNTITNGATVDINIQQL